MRTGRPTAAKIHFLRESLETKGPLTGFSFEHMNREGLSCPVRLQSNARDLEFL